MPAAPFAMRWRLADARRPKRVAVPVSKVERRLLDLLWRRRWVRRGPGHRAGWVVRATHRPSLRDRQRLGREIERAVLARAVALDLEDRILVNGDETVVFA